MWGTHTTRKSNRYTPRFIPTHVGNCSGKGRCIYRGFGSSPRMWGTQVAGLTVFGFTVHPHACGELIICFSAISYRIGSSPRMWGTRSCLEAEHGMGSVHPHACGELYAPPGLNRELPVHPHACGELRKVPKGNAFAVHPHACGELELSVWHGKSGAVHPHACGELVGRKFLRPRMSGSSPRMWGTHWNRRVPKIL